MKLVFKMQGLDCANCAAKAENKIKKLDGVNSVNVGFMTQRITLEIDDERQNEVMSGIRDVLAKVDPEITLMA